MKTFTNELQQARTDREQALTELKKIEQLYWQTRTNNAPLVQITFYAWKEQVALLYYQRVSEHYFSLRDNAFKEGLCDNLGITIS